MAGATVRGLFGTHGWDDGCREELTRELGTAELVPKRPKSLAETTDAAGTYCGREMKQGTF